MSERLRESSEQMRLSRRTLLKGFGGAAVIAGLGLTLGCDLLKKPEEDFIAELKLASEKAGSKPLTFEQAKSHVSPIARLFVASGATGKPIDLERKIFIARADPKEDIEYGQSSLDDPRRKQPSPTSKQLLEDYPNVDFGRWESYMGSYNIGGLRGVVVNNQVFVFLWNTNIKPGEPYANGRLRSPKLKRYNKAGQINGKDATPFDVFLSSTLTALRSLEVGDESFLPLDKELILANQSLCQQADPKADCSSYAPGGKKGFYMPQFYSSKEDRYASYAFSSLESDILEYLTAKALLDHGLYASGLTPNSSMHVLNFGKVFRQAGISDQELVALHRQSNIKDFMLKIARGAKGVSFAGDQEAINFAFQLFNRNLSELGDDNFIWEKKFKPYYPDLDLNIQPERVYLPHLQGEVVINDSTWRVI